MGFRCPQHLSLHRVEQKAVKDLKLDHFTSMAFFRAYPGQKLGYNGDTISGTIVGMSMENTNQWDTNIY